MENVPIGFCYGPARVSRRGMTSAFPRGAVIVLSLPTLMMQISPIQNASPWFACRPKGGVWRVRVDLARSAAGAGKEFRFLYGASDGKLREHVTEYDAWTATTTDTAVWCMPASTTESLKFGRSGLGEGDENGDGRGGTAPAGTHIGFTLQGEPAWIESLSVRLTRLSD